MELEDSLLQWVTRFWFDRIFESFKYLNGYLGTVIAKKRQVMYVVKTENRVFIRHTDQIHIDINYSHRLT